ncbi:hypothetical protein DPMN_025328 [Dreissena polymorpha]|uniref:Uncharacterized protein n=1 Tax=Dreissena polymorpha TaxID=45954 RepID=A0A9D4LRC0_DREPO|nr:hypothetical protein DPMN_025328 [Dreissena polymorpha]
MATQSDRVFFFGCVSCKKNKNIEEYAVYYCENVNSVFVDSAVSYIMTICLVNMKSTTD